MSMPKWVDALRTAAIAIVALELVAVELVDRVPLYSCAFGRVTLGLATDMMETALPSPSLQNRESTAVLRALPRGHACGQRSPSHHRNPSHLG